MSAQFSAISIEASGVHCGCESEDRCHECNGPLFWIGATPPDEASDNFATLSCRACGAEHYDGPVDFEQCRRIWGLP